ncbi:LysM peptidoglycan-binding domain-containing protein [Paenibacillus sp. OV219]|uniref:LysM peptidoglycan-binding domain-containing protein n=1 Tax=Paenibacillus sp. OV219 TaxID=1884377 RepID=UPI0008C25EF3|nr:LysM peptidoglycan-binding domain-containing protein [Paenibacillus sp. OV219]SEM66955.1 stage VI sporulation protein D [Paenibacillus sp. OV219]
MPSQSNGLRFDIYERVHLPDEVAAIDELEEIELVPRIGIVQQDEQVLLKGHLLLTGVYRAQDEPLAEQSLEHWIPVEITLPMNRIHRLDDISVEIDNFDVDLLSTRTLNITGVLSLKGIELGQSSPQEEWQREEPFTVVHKRDPVEVPNYETLFEQQTGYAEPQAIRNEGWEPAGSPPTYNEAFIRDAAAQAAQAAFEQEETARVAAIVRQQQLEEEAREAEAALQAIESEVPDEVIEAAIAGPPAENPFIADAAEREARSRQLAANIADAPAAQQFGDISAFEAESARKLKVAVGGKPAEEEAEVAQPPGVGFRSLLQSSRREQEARAAAEQSAEQAAKEARKSSGDDIEWKNLFFSRSGEDQSFRKLRICIVQREETLDVIAGRYQLQPREIALYNRLPDQSISEGQVLYIP